MMIKKMKAALFVSIFSCITTQVAFANTDISAELWDDGAIMGISLDKASAPAGEVTFKVSNKSAYYEHEMLVVKVKNYSDALPFIAEKGRIDEDKINAIGEVPELEKGKITEKTFKLEPGNYLLLCNVRGHFAMGMFTPFIVTKNP